MELACIRGLLVLSGVLTAMASVPVLAAAVNFDVVLTKEVDGQTAKVGQPVQAHLLGDLRIGSKLIAPAGSHVSGHITSVYGRRRLLHAEVSTKRWLKAGGGIDMQFDRLVAPGGAPIAMRARPIDIVVPGHASRGGGTLDVSKQGTIETPRKRDLKPKLARTALGVAAFVVGPVTAVAGAAVGAARPSTVVPDAGDRAEQKHRRLKGMATGFVAGLPGGFLINDSVLKGQKVVLQPGTRLKLEWQR